MKTYRDIICECPLFEGISETNIVSLLKCLKARTKTFQKNEVIFREGDRPEYVGIVLYGRVHIVQDDFWGNRSILASVMSGDLFGEAISCAESDSFPVSAIALSTTTVLMINYRQIITTCSSACVFHTSLIRNMLKILATKNLGLTRKIEHITKKTTREKVLSYLSEQALLAHSDNFQIPFNRQELADYLSVERSALSSTLSKMQEEGLITFHKHSFSLIKK
ncbi:MAG: Crp/Fnr family transcriptional regulator [Oscillospiraceae bacterium]|jgi:CRP-like cAMP-binding protein|nr:Crp/Fnr family transcriptional regulator [Oscillospiraceae bacterium]